MHPLFRSLVAASRRPAIATSSYVSEVLADSPYAFYRLNESSGATTINDSSGNGRHVSGVSSNITFGHRALTTDPTGGSALFNANAGISLGSSLASAILGNSTWSVEFFCYPDPTNSTNNAGYPISGAASSTQRFAVQHFNDTVYIQSTVGGIRSTSTSKVTNQVHHFVICSDGTAYWNGATISGPTNPTLNSTVGFWIGCLNSGASGFFKGRISEVSLYQSVLSAARVTAHYNAGRQWTIPAGRTFYWDMESDFSNEQPRGAADHAYYYAASRTTAQAFAGTNSLNITGNFWSVWFNNGHSHHAWANLDSCAIRFKFRYSGTIAGTCMLFQMTGKDITGRNDTNDGMALLLSSSGLLSGAIPIASMPPDMWHDVIYRFNRAGPNYIILTVNGTTVTSTTPPAAVTCNAWHQLLIGNDRAYNPTGLWLDNFEVHGSWNSPDLPAYP